MGAFDAELYSLGYRFNTKPEVKSESKPRTTFYVSWNGSLGGLTGQHFKAEKEAIEMYMSKLLEGKEPSAWFDLPPGTPRSHYRG